MICVQLGLEPSRCLTVVGGLAIDCVEQDVGVDQHQRPLGPPSCSSASATLLTSTVSASLVVRWRKGSCGRLTVSPARTRSLIASLTPTPCSLRSLLTAAATSGSNDTVVRMLKL